MTPDPSREIEQVIEEMREGATGDGYGSIKASGDDIRKWADRLALLTAASPVSPDVNRRANTLARIFNKAADDDGLDLSMHLIGVLVGLFESALREDREHASESHRVGHRTVAGARRATVPVNSEVFMTDGAEGGGASKATEEAVSPVSHDVRKWLRKWLKHDDNCAVNAERAIEVTCPHCLGTGCATDPKHQMKDRDGRPWPTNNCAPCAGRAGKVIKYPTCTCGLDAALASSPVSGEKEKR